MTCSAWPHDPEAQSPAEQRPAFLACLGPVEPRRESSGMQTLQRAQNSKCDHRETATPPARTSTLNQFGYRPKQGFAELRTPKRPLLEESLYGFGLGQH